MTWFTFFCLWFTAGAYYPAQPQFTPSVQAGPVIMNPAPQQPQPPPQPAQHIPTKRERKQVQSAFLIQKCATLQTLCAALRCMWYRICVLPAYDLCVSSITFAFMQNHHVSLDRLNIILNNHMLLAKKNPWKLSKRRHYKKVNTALKQSWQENYEWFLKCWRGRWSHPDDLVVAAGHMFTV